MRAGHLVGLLGAGLAMGLAAPLAARPLQIGLSAMVTSLDPHFYSITPNNSAAFHVFDRLVHRGPEGRLEPGLALAWQPLSETTWEFRLRPGVTWHDGQPFTAADAGFSLARARHVPNSLGGFENLVRPITAIEIIDPLTLRLTTATPTPTLPSDLSFIAIVSAHLGRDATTADYNAGRVNIGTGAFRFLRHVQGDRIVMARNDAWWNGRAAWESVTLRMVPNIGARMASLLAGELDLVEAPSASDLARLRQHGDVLIHAAPGSRVAYVNPIFAPAPNAPAITDRQGRAIEPTPLGDRRVRQALSLAINRQAIADRLLLGTGTATGQWLPPGSYSAVPDLDPPRFDPARARALLTEAGFPDGFRMTLTTANDRTPYAVEITQAIAQMWSRIGVQVSVEAIPFAVYSARGQRQQVSAYFGSLNNPSMEAGLLLRNLLMTVNPEAGTGTFNWSRYANPALDRLAGRALATMDGAAREGLLIEAARLALADVAFIPIYQFQNLWASRRGITYQARADELTLGADAQDASRQDTQ
ncbi:ABC transporter substrate-binding protein [Roseomonas hellenica]|uniref:ABC transporter substrate-binding protein n=1 Tax=Plastoroseomonas hellenica TaxID=2687306 RepID=A0ABS5EYU8_9PROT|nr:ABC transporter substrate-binding protein [Plastoroseomonas hellenica]MBR0665467.1 ABC transporter substrate-binding protein [Plastoroseomonas hellenica]